MVKKKKMYVATVYLYQDGKSYGSTTRQYPAYNKSDAIKVFKRKFKFKDNVVVVRNLRLYSDVYGKN